MRWVEELGYGRWRIRFPERRDGWVAAMRGMLVHTGRGSRCQRAVLGGSKLARAKDMVAGESMSVLPATMTYFDGLAEG